MNIKAIHNLSRPGEPPAAGDTVEIECVGGFVCEVDPATRTARQQHQRFTVQPDGELTPRPARA